MDIQTPGLALLSLAGAVVVCVAGLPAPRTIVEQPEEDAKAPFWLRLLLVWRLRRTDVNETATFRGQARVPGRHRPAPGRTQIHCDPVQRGRWKGIRRTKG